MPDTVESSIPVVQDPAVGEAAIALLMPLLSVIPEAKLRVPNVDTNLAAFKVLALVGALDPKLKARMEALPPEEFDFTLVGVLVPAARAVIHTRAQLAIVQSIDPCARLPVNEAQQATERRERMLQVLGYHLGDDPDGEHGDAVRELQHVRSGNGYLDLANDLIALAGLYRRFEGLLAGDTLRYRSADADEADRSAVRIQNHLGEKQDKRRSADQLLAARAWTFMVYAYEEVSAAGRWLLRDEPGSASLFPSLGEGRRRRRASATQPQPTPVPDGE